MTRIVPRDDPVLVQHYADLLATQPADAVIVETPDKVYRFQSDPLLMYLHVSHKIDLNRMCMHHQKGVLSLSDYMRYYRGIGYSLSGFIEIFGDSLELA